MGASEIAILDRTGRTVTTLGERAFYDSPALSPDKTRLIVSRFDPEAETDDLWLFDVASGKGTKITSNVQREFTDSVVWSPNGREIAYVGLRSGYFGLYRKPADGSKEEELLYKSPGGFISLTDWTRDGRYLLFAVSDLVNGVIYAMPFAGADRTPVEVFRTRTQVQAPSLSPDGRSLAYFANESGNSVLYMRPFDPSAPGRPLGGQPTRIYDRGTVTVPVLWRQDGRELLFWSSERALLAVDVRAGSMLTLGEPRPLFQLPLSVAFNASLGRPSLDGERVALTRPRTPVLQEITVFDREGKVLEKVGEAGRFVQPAISPDGSRVVVMKTDTREGDVDIWSYDVATGKGVPVTTDTLPANAPIWSPDGQSVAYASVRGTFASIYRRAWDGSGDEEQMFQHSPGAGLVLTDWSRDGRFMTFHDGVLHVLPVEDGVKPVERKSIEWLRDEFNVAQARFSPDQRFIAFLSDEHKTREEANWGIADVYVRPFDPAVTDATTGPPAVRVSSTGAVGMIMWRQDGRELYYISPEWEVMVVDVATTPAFSAGTPRMLFKLPAPVIGNPQQWRSVSADGQRFVFTVNVPEPASTR